jgi:hypothetical protein
MKSRTPVTIWILALGVLILSACASTQAKRVNPVEQAGLRDTVKIDVMEFNSWNAESWPYIHRMTITDSPMLGRLLDALDTNLQVTLKLACIPEYELHFHLRDGTVQTFGYSCHGASFIRGEQGFWEGEDYDPPEQFDGLIEEQLALNPREPIQASINVVEEAGLTSTVEIEITRIHSSSSSGDGIGEAQVYFEHLLTISDAEVVGQLVASLDAMLDLMPRHQCLPEYRLRFKLSDDTLYDMSYGCGTEGDPVTRGSQPFWRGMDVLPPAEFNALLEQRIDG